MARTARPLALASALAISLGGGAVVPANAAATKTLTIADLRHIVSLSSPQIAPDGRRVVVLVRRPNYTKDRNVDDLSVVDVRTRAMRTLIVDGHISDFAWSPDGSQIAYVAQPKDDAASAPQLFMLPMNGGEPVQLSHEKNGVDAFDWRPDGRALAYSATPELAAAKAIEHHEDAFDVTEEAWTEQSATPRKQLYEIAARSGAKPQRIGDGSWSVGGGFTYAPDGRSVFATRIKAGAQPNQYLARAIVRVWVAGGALTPIAALSSTQGDPLRSVDGKHIAFPFANPHGTMQTEIAISDASAMHPAWTSKALDRNIAGAAFLPNDTLIVEANDRTTRRFFYLTASGARALPLGDVTVTSAPSVARNGAIAFTGMTPVHPTELYVLDPGASSPRRLTSENAWISSYALGKHETVTWRTRDGLTADGVLTYPPKWHPGMHAPLVLVIHGGPTSASLTSFMPFADVLASHGWFVFQPNYRGSDNLGVVFARTTVPHIASVPGDDIEDGLAAVLKLGIVDPSRIGVSGWSEGGLMTSWLITHDTRWKAAVSGAAVNDWMNYASMTDSKDFTPQFIGNAPWVMPSTRAMYDAESPLTYASNVKTPTLILSDASDYRVPTPLSFEFYHEIRATGTPVKFMVWPVLGHFPRDPVRIEDIYRAWESWLVQYL